MFDQLCLALGSAFSRLLWSIYKWIYHKVTGNSEIKRICYGNDPLTSKIINIEKSLYYSKVRALNQIVKRGETVDPDSAVGSILAAKGIDESDNKCLDLLENAVRKIIEVRNLGELMNIRVKERYSSQNEIHEATLSKLWTLLKPEEPLENRISSQWTGIGFQGNDPATDFRGMGMLGLNDMIHFATKHKGIALKQLGKSNHPTIGYPFAITSINITSMVYELMQKGYLKAHYFSIPTAAINIQEHHDVQNLMFVEFDEFWFASNPKSIMEFNIVRKKFKKGIKQRLKEGKPLDVEKLSKLSIGLS